MVKDAEFLPRARQEQRVPHPAIGVAGVQFGWNDNCIQAASKGSRGKASSTHLVSCRQTILEVPNDAGLGLRWRAPHARPFYDTQRPPGIQSRAACAMNCRLSGSVHQLCEE